MKNNQENIMISSIVVYPCRLNVYATHAMFLDLPPVNLIHTHMLLWRPRRCDTGLGNRDF